MLTKTFFAIFFGCCLVACSSHSPKQEFPDFTANENITDNHQELQQLLDSMNVKGVILVFDPQSGTTWSNDFQGSHTGTLPASTFKIPNTLIALETGVVEDENTLFPWDGNPRPLKVWDRDMVLREAFHASCVPCYQQIARETGAGRMNLWLDTLNYGDMQVDENNIDVFWLEGNSKISPYQQMDFLTRFYYSQLPVSERTMQIMKELIVIETNEHWQLSGKTGWAIRAGLNIGWYVGYLEKDGNVYFVATCVEPLETFNMQMFNMVRRNIAMEAFRVLNIIEN